MSATAVDSFFGDVSNDALSVGRGAMSEVMYTRVHGERYRGAMLESSSTPQCRRIKVL